MKSNWTKIAGIILATILSLALLFYLGGLVCQIHCNYVQWMSGGGITGDATIAPIKTGILDCCCVWCQRNNEIPRCDSASPISVHPAWGIRCCGRSKVRNVR